MPPALHWLIAQDYVPRWFFTQIFSSIQGFTQGSLGLILVSGDLFVLGTRTLCKGAVMIRWSGRLGRCVGTSYHASFCCGCAVGSGCVLGHLIVNNDVPLHFPLYYNDVAVVMFV